MRSSPPAGDTILNDHDFWIRTVTAEMVRERLDAGDDVDQATLAGDSAIVWAGNARAGIDVWRVLVERGADLLAPLHDRRPAIFWVSKGGTPEAVRLVLAQPGVDVHVVDSVGRNAFAHAVRAQPDLQVYRVLEDAGIEVHRRDVNGRTALHEAGMRTAYVHVLEHLEDVGLEVDAVDRHGWSPFLNAAWRNPSIDVVQHLAARASLASSGYDGLNAAMLAVENNPSVVVLDWLLDQGLDVGGRDPHGATALVRAGRNSAEVVRRLLGLGRDVGETDAQGSTAFVVAPRAKRRAPEIIEVLLAAGADPTVVNARNENALMTALAIGGERDGGPETALMLMHRVRLATDLVTIDGDTALGIAARARQPRHVVEALLAAGVPVDARDRDGWTPLMRYCDRGYDVETISALIAAGADGSLRAPNGRTAAELAAGNPSLAGEEIVDAVAA